MLFYFSPTTDFTTETFEEDGKHYLYSLEITEEGIVISDTCNRTMPFDKADMKELGTAIFAANTVFTAEAEAEALFAKRLNELDQLLNFWEKN